MFTPDNFYVVLRQKFGDDKSNVLHVPVWNGAKDILLFNPYLDTNRLSEFKNSPLAARMEIPRTILYDQEPIDSSAVVSLLTAFLDLLDTDLHYIVTQASFAQLMALWLPSVSFPILCTSDYKGSEIETLKASHYITCAYWYHAFISRDWFRHYQYWPTLDPVDRDRAPYRFLMYARDSSGSRAYRNTVKQALSPLAAKILHDWNNQKHLSSDLSASIDSADAGSAAVHLVLETLFDSDKLYLTEKIFKPMIMNQAFIVWAPPGTLKFIRSRGFRTFETVWSEAYDDEADADKRMHMLIDLVNDLSRTTPDEWSRIWQKCLPIIEHNRRWFYSDSFMNDCWQELVNNINSALLQRQELSTTHPGGQFFRIIDDYPEIYQMPSRRAMVRQYLSFCDGISRSKILSRYPQFNDL